MLQIAASELEKESAAKEQEKANYLAEHCPPLHMPSSMQELQVMISSLSSPVQEQEHVNFMYKALVELLI